VWGSQLVRCCLPPANLMMLQRKGDDAAKEK
jgi:hypothetical protein